EERVEIPSVERLGCAMAQLDVLLRHPRSVSRRPRDPSDVDQRYCRQRHARDASQLKASKYARIRAVYVLAGHGAGVGAAPARTVCPRSHDQARDHKNETGDTDDPAASEQPASPDDDRDSRQYDPDLKANRG